MTMNRRRFMVLAVALVAVNTFFWVAQGGFALPRAVINQFFGSQMVRAEVLLKNGEDGEGADCEPAVEHGEVGRDEVRQAQVVLQHFRKKQFRLLNHRDLQHLVLDDVAHAPVRPHDAVLEVESGGESCVELPARMLRVVWGVAFDGVRANIAYASTIAVIFFLIIVAISMIQRFALRTREA